MRFYELDGGKISIDGVDTRMLTRNKLRHTFGMVLQDTWLFGGTIRENIAYGRENATRARSSPRPKQLTWITLSARRRTATTR